MENNAKHEIIAMNATQMCDAIADISRNIIACNPDVHSLVLVGIQRRGLPLARRIAAEIKRAQGTDVPVGMVDISLYRDDLSTIADLPQMKKTDLPFPITDANVVLVDDVLYTGRTTRAAIEMIAREGRPRRIQLVALIDRGLRELPIAADYVGMAIRTSPAELVAVNVTEIDGEDKVIVNV
jgi:pyrimidine operon attenuation protein/uracil phosphoribosyltransferase